MITFRQPDNLHRDPEQLTRFAGDFIDSLKSRFNESYVLGIAGYQPDSVFTLISDFVSSNLPVYLEEEDYKKIESLLTVSGIARKMAENYRLLLSPAGYALKQNLLGDPLGISLLAMNHLKPVEEAGKYKLYQGFLFTSNLETLILIVAPANPSSETSRNSFFLKGIDEIVLHIQKDGNQNIKANYFGSIAVACGNARQIKKDILLTLIVALTLIFALLGWYFRSIKVPLLGFLPALYGGGFSLALLYLLKSHVSAIALGIGSVILGLIIDYALYFINHYRRKGSIEKSLSEMSLTIILCSITTAAAFLCLVF
ncbi:MAG: MMPL family transporter, partial [Bacteroidota bacterium]